jgi:hypothetical protein
MNENNVYLYQLLQKYEPKDLGSYNFHLNQLKSLLKTWANTCYVAIHDSGSRAKGTAIALASDVDFLVSLTSQCNQTNGGLKGIYNSLASKLKGGYENVRRQNVSIRITIYGLEVDVTPGKLQGDYTSDHSLYLSKSDTWQKTNIEKHIRDVSTSGHINEIKLLKIWRVRHQLDFPSIYLEYLVINKILLYKSYDLAHLADNFFYILKELARDYSNPLFSEVIDPANSSNILSNLLTIPEKNQLISKAKEAINQRYWSNIVW